MLIAARSGDAGAAWLTVQDAAIDLRIEVPASETARRFGTRLVQQHGAPAAEMSQLISAIERTSYAPGEDMPTGRAGQRRMPRSPSVPPCSRRSKVRADCWRSWCRVR